jgi:hypothetical protein
MLKKRHSWRKRKLSSEWKMVRRQNRAGRALWKFGEAIFGVTKKEKGGRFVGQKGERTFLWNLLKNDERRGGPA